MKLIKEEVELYFTELVKEYKLPSKIDIINISYLDESMIIIFRICNDDESKFKFNDCILKVERKTKNSYKQTVKKKILELIISFGHIGYIDNHDRDKKLKWLLDDKDVKLK